MTEAQENKNFRSGIVSIVGRPNTGKSTLLNKLVGEKVAIVSKVAQTTRNPVRGIYNDERGQIVFVDTPGLHVSRDRLGEIMNRSAHGTTSDAECIIHLVDTKDPVGKEEEQIAERLKFFPGTVILGLNKIDISRGRYIPDYISLWERIKGKPAQEIERFILLPLSGQAGTNMDKLLDMLFELLPVGPALYPRDAVTDVPQRMAIADIIREKLFEILRQEVPHSLGVVIEKMQMQKEKVLHIYALILVEKESQKVIVIGKGGHVLKEIGTAARIELENLLETKVFLKIYVKDKPHWRDDNSLLQEMGYDFL